MKPERQKMHKSYRFLSLITAITGLSTVPNTTASAGIQTLNPAADTFVSSTNPTNAYGGAGALEVSAPGLTNGEFQSVMKFNLAAAKAGFDAEFGIGQWAIQSLTLQLTAANPNNPIFNPNASGTFNISWMQNDTWLEGGGTPIAPTAAPDLTFATLPSFLSGSDQSLGSFTSPGTNSGANTYTLTLASSFVTDLLAGGDVSMRVFVSSGAASYLFNSRNFGTVANRPLLTITAVPEPTSAIIVPAIALIMLRRRRP